ncbi:Uncharacterised protein [Chryseobacterium gleum]|uniref:C1q domain n=2 Tax=Chryseobacterium gleum TaxID=250 RepID=A0A448B7B2_CHRGE|nr:hypothetical protein [Chryseobacterium gleum]EFK38099.1 hypothetical protein HMPREF0204_10045 [Chryseobacterium gleum ATCC 35910]MCD9619293.1 hypothetical protein [Chryseobacterium gleum]QQY32423.1 hypothetical protein I6I60_01100 [Chryseobacterium gleum]VEE10366.1 Uncharacterised protein [Chryseobacterium gleum]
MIKKHKLLILPFCFFTYVFNAQIGIGTNNPLGSLHVDGAKDNPASGVPTSAQLSNDVIINKTTGFIGAGVLNPLVQLDMRSAGSENSLGLGTTSMSAVAAGAGATRYDVNNIPVGAKIQVSDGAVWNKVYLAPQKAVVVVRKIVSQSIPTATPTTITNWSEVRDMSNSFDPSTGEFTAPRNGTYTFLLTFNFTGAVINDGSRVESQFYNPATGIVLASVYKTFGQSMTGTADDANATRSTQAGGSSTVTLTLTAGTKVSARLYQNLTSGAIPLRVTSNSSDPANPDDGFNNLTIIEH